MEKLGGLINSPYDESHASISADMKTLCFTSNRPGGYGAMDIYFSTRGSDGQWSEPVNAGGVVNSLYSEATPFLTDDGSTLYFSSMGHATMGGYDIFYCKRLPDNTWSVPANIGFPLSTSDDDLFYFPLNQGTDALYCNVYQTTAREKVEWIHINPENEEANFTVSGEIKTEDNEQINEKARVEVVSKSSGDTVAVLTPDPNTGKYTAEVPSGDYKIEIDADDYKTEHLDLDLDHGTGQQNIRVESNLKPESVASGEFLLVKNLLFGFDDYQIDREGMVELEKLFQVMTKYPDIYVQVRGHTDSKGSSAYNLDLSRKRARSVVDYLVSKGIARERFVSSGIGEESNIAINTNPDGTDNPEGRRLNRQVEIKLINNHYNDVRLEEISVPERLKSAREKHYYVILEQSPAVLNSFPQEVQGQKTRLFETDNGALYTVGPFNQKPEATGYLNTVIDSNYPEAYLVEEQDFRRLIRSAYFNPGELKGPFTIQLMALKNEIDFSMFSHPENIQLFEGKDGYHRYVTGIFEVYNQAKIKANDYINQGYTDAFVMPLSSYTNTPRIDMDNRDPDFYFTVQITATKNKPDPAAYRVIPEVRITLKGDGFYRVSQGIYLRKIEAEKALEQIRNKGFTDAFIRKIEK